MRVRRRAGWPGVRLTVAPVLVLLLGLTGCGALGDSSAPDPSATASTQSPSAEPASPSVTSSADPTASPSGTPMATASPGTASPSPGSTPGSTATPYGSASPSPTIDPTTGDRQLGLGDFFDPGPTWTEGRFGIPVVGEVTGIASETDNCDKNQAILLEFRNDTQYKTLSLMAGPSKTTADSGKKLVVAVYNNENLIDSVSIPYGAVAPLKGVKIETVSALKIRMYLDDEKGCNTNGVTGVLYDIRVR